MVWIIIKTIMSKIKPLTIKEYASPFYYNSRENVLKLVNKESTLEWCKRNEIALIPEYKKPPSQKLTVGLFNFISQLKP